MTKRIELDCGHVLYLETAPDTVDETLWCSRCGTYRELAPTVAKLRGVWVINAAEDFRSKREGKRRFIGECTYANCHHTNHSNKSWFHLRDLMHKHYVNAHTNFGGVTIEYQTITPKDPPF